MFGPDSEGVTLTRDVQAVVVPMGDKVNLPEGTACTITQSLGGSFTVYIAGNLFRIAGEDADALGKENTGGPELPENATDEDVKALIWEQLKTCYDPEIPINIVDLGLVYECEIEHSEDGNRRLRIAMTLTAPGCGMGDIIAEDVRSKMMAIPSIEHTDVDLVFDPPWTMEHMSEAAKIQAGMI